MTDNIFNDFKWVKLLMGFPALCLVHFTSTVSGQIIKSNNGFPMEMQFLVVKYQIKQQQEKKGKEGVATI